MSLLSTTPDDRTTPCRTAGSPNPGGPRQYLPKELAIKAAIDRFNAPLLTGADLHRLGMFPRAKEVLKQADLWAVPVWNISKGGSGPCAEFRKEDVLAVLGASQWVPLKLLRQSLSVPPGWHYTRWAERHQVRLMPLDHAPFIARADALRLLQQQGISRPAPTPVPAPEWATALDKSQRDFVATVDALYELMQEDRQLHTEQLRILFRELSALGQKVDALRALWEK